MAKPAIAPIQVDFTQGEDLLVTCRHREYAGGPPKDIAGYAIKVRIRKKRTDAATVIPEIDGTLVSTSGGIYTWGIAHATSKDLAPGDYAIDIWNTQAGAYVVMADGTMSVGRPVGAPPA